MLSSAIQCYPVLSRLSCPPLWFAAQWWKNWESNPEVRTVAAYTQVSSQALNRLHHVVDPMGRVKGVPADWNYIVMRSEVKTLGGIHFGLSLSRAGRSSKQHCQKTRCFSVMRLKVQRESQLKYHSHRQGHRFSKAFFCSLDRYFGHLGCER